LSAAIDLLEDLAVIGARIESAGDRIILRAGATAIPAGLVGRIREAKAELLAMLAPDSVATDMFHPEEERVGPEAELVASSGRVQRVALPAEGEPDFNKRCVMRRGRVEQRDGVLLHFCTECGRWGGFGCGVDLRAGRLGRWYCAEHRPQSDVR
jgi:hypothetical protein